MVLTEVGSQGRAEPCRYCSRRTKRLVEGPFVRVSWAAVRYTFRGALELCHCSRGYGYPWPRRSAVVTVTRGAGDAWAHCQSASAGGADIHTMVGAHNPALCKWSRDTW